MESAAISYGSLNPDAPGIYIQTLSKMNDTDDGMSCLSVCHGNIWVGFCFFLTATFFIHSTN